MSQTTAKLSHHARLDMLVNDKMSSYGNKRTDSTDHLDSRASVIYPQTLPGQLDLGKVANLWFYSDDTEGGSILSAALDDSGTADWRRLIPCLTKCHNAGETEKR